MLLDDYPDVFTVIEFHLSDPYELPWCRTRANFYGVSGIPVTWFDGLVQCLGAYTNDQQMYNWYLGVINSRLAIPTDVSLDISAVEVAAQTYEVSVRIGIDQGGVGKDMRVHLAQVLDYYPPWGDNRYRNNFMQVSAHTDVTLAAGESTTITPEWGDPGDPGYPYLYLDGVNWDNKEDVKLVCFAREPGSPGPKEVYNSSYISWPIAGIPGDVDGDGDVDLSDLAALLATYDLCEGDPGYNPNADFNGDGCVDLSDLATLLGNYPYP